MSLGLAKYGLCPVVLSCCNVSLYGSLVITYFTQSAVVICADKRSTSDQGVVRDDDKKFTVISDDCGFSSTGKTKFLNRETNTVTFDADEITRSILRSTGCGSDLTAVANHLRASFSQYVAGKPPSQRPQTVRQYDGRPVIFEIGVLFKDADAKIRHIRFPVEYEDTSTNGTERPHISAVPRDSSESVIFAGEPGLVNSVLKGEYAGITGAPTAVREVLRLLKEGLYNQASVRNVIEFATWLIGETSKSTATVSKECDCYVFDNVKGIYSAQ